MHLTIEFDGWTYYFKYKEHFDAAVTKATEGHDRGTALRMLATATVDPEGFVMKDRLNGYRKCPMYSTLYAYLEYTIPPEKDPLGLDYNDRFWRMFDVEDS